MGRRLRIAVSVFFALLAVAICVLWVRSFWTADRLHFPLSSRQSFVIASKQGRMALVAYRQGSDPNQWQTGRYSYPVDDDLAFPLGNVRQYETAIGFGVIQQPGYFVPEMTLPMLGKPPGWVTTYNAGAMTLPGSGVILPYWSLVLLIVAIAGVLNFRQLLQWHFSLRTLLIATTLIAVVLALAVWLTS